VAFVVDAGVLLSDVEWRWVVGWLLLLELFSILTGFVDDGLCFGVDAVDCPCGSCLFGLDSLGSL